MEEFLAHRLQRTKGLSQALSEPANFCEADKPARRVLSGLLRATFLQRMARLARTIPPSQTAAFLERLEPITCETFEKINDLPAVHNWRRDLLFESVNDGGTGLMPLCECRRAAFLARASPEAQHEIIAGRRDPTVSHEIEQFEEKLGVTVTEVGEETFVSCCSQGTYPTTPSSPQTSSENLGVIGLNAGRPGRAPLTKSQRMALG